MINIPQIAKYLGLKRPFQIELKSRTNTKMDASWEGLYNSKGKLSSHLITVYLGNISDRSLDSLIAHELIHAWQEEKGIIETHGSDFKIKSLQLAHMFELSAIYIPGRDI